ncbi:MAG: response regulator [Myxococcota bacterium]
MKTIHSLLIVDDNPADIEIAEYYIEKTGRVGHIFSVGDGDEALALFQDYETARKQHPEKFPPMVVLLDINMPRLNGFDFLEEFSKIEFAADEIPSIVVMLTSSKHAEDRARADTFDSVKGYLVKPLRLEDAEYLADTFGADGPSGLGA